MKLAVELQSRRAAELQSRRALRNAGRVCLELATGLEGPRLPCGHLYSVGCAATRGAAIGLPDACPAAVARSSSSSSECRGAALIEGWR
jgi:hypothetical protein